MDTGYQFQPALTGHWLLSLAETPDESPERWNNHRNVSHHIAATTSLATRFSGQWQAVWYGAGMKLTAGDFPLRAIGVHIYARSQSSPVLTADWPERAEQITAWLNAHEGLIASMAQNGPTLVTMGGHDHLASS